MNTKKFFLIFYIFLLSACGGVSSEEENSVEAVAAVVKVDLPSNMDTEEFWAGVEERIFSWRPIDSDHVAHIKWSEMDQANWDLSKGGYLLFQGRSAQKNLLVEGGLEVKSWVQENNQAKEIVISLDRVAYD